ncbi:hypothetical protein M422DRAFT_252133 [Sphaerobolus stellatus SS14]|uniref:Uncharacterized protein n=1 Tax=Sphaerobolus stellatus (strain SS14) TaxID=990650 RepID=A0A0C9UNF0_SPHS4|nr:hypothetical protein M422DRAFT_252133 [Sphaerobolus stellatus SS14]
MSSYMSSSNNTIPTFNIPSFNYPNQFPTHSHAPVPLIPSCPPTFTGGTNSTIFNPNARPIRPSSSMSINLDDGNILANYGKPSERIIHDTTDPMHFKNSVARLSHTELLESGSNVYQKLLADFQAFQTQYHMLEARHRTLKRVCFDAYTQLLDKIPQCGCQIPITSGTTSNSMVLSTGPGLSKYCFNRVDYPGIPYWTRSEHNKQLDAFNATEDEQDPSELSLPCKTLAYITHEDGTSINGYLAARIRSVTRSGWEKIRLSKLAPSTWGGASTDATKILRLAVYEEYPILAFCDNHWKLDMLMRNDYPGWCKSVRKRGLEVVPGESAMKKLNVKGRVKTEHTKIAPQIAMEHSTETVAGAATSIIISSPATSASNDLTQTESTSKTAQVIPPAPSSNTVSFSPISNNTSQPSQRPSALLFSSAPQRESATPIAIIERPSTPPQSNDTNGANGAKKLPDQQNVPPTKGPVGLNPFGGSRGVRPTSVGFPPISASSKIPLTHKDGTRISLTNTVSKKTRTTKDHSDAFHFSVSSTVKLNLFGGDLISKNPGVKYTNAEVSAAFKKLSKAELNVYSERRCQLLEKKKTAVNPESMVEDGMQENMSDTETLETTPHPGIGVWLTSPANPAIITMLVVLHHLVEENSSVLSDSNHFPRASLLLVASVYSDALTALAVKLSDIFNRRRLQNFWGCHEQGHSMCILTKDGSHLNIEEASLPHWLQALYLGRATIERPPREVFRIIAESHGVSETSTQIFLPPHRKVTNYVAEDLVSIASSSNSSTSDTSTIVGVGSLTAKALIRLGYGVSKIVGTSIIWIRLRRSRRKLPLFIFSGLNMSPLTRVHSNDFVTTLTLVHYVEKGGYPLSFKLQGRQMLGTLNDQLIQLTRNQGFYHKETTDELNHALRVCRILVKLYSNPHSSYIYSKELGKFAGHIQRIIRADQLPLTQINAQRLFLLTNALLSAFHSCSYSSQISEQTFPAWYHLVKFLVWLSSLLKTLDDPLPPSTKKLMNNFQSSKKNAEEHVGYSSWEVQLLGYWECLDPSIRTLVNGKGCLQDIFEKITQLFIAYESLSPEQDLELGITLDAVAYIVFCVPSVVISSQMCRSLLQYLKPKIIASRSHWVPRKLANCIFELVYQHLDLVKKTLGTYPELLKLIPEALLVFWTRYPAHYPFYRGASVTLLEEVERVRSGGHSVGTCKEEGDGLFKKVEVEAKQRRREKGKGKEMDMEAGPSRKGRGRERPTGPAEKDKEKEQEADPLEKKKDKEKNGEGSGSSAGPENE